MFKAVVSLVSLGFFFAATTSVAASHSSFKRDNASYCPYPPYSTRSLFARQANSDLDFSGSQWIWTNEVNTNTGVAPVGARAFRKTFGPPEGKTPSTLTIAFAVDDSATLFVNGEDIASQTGWTTSGTYCVTLKPCMNVIAFNASTIGGPAALLVTGEVTYTDGTTSRIVSDQSWRTSGASIPNGFEQPSFDDSSWPLAIGEGAYPMAEFAGYGQVTIAGNNPVSINSANWIWTNELPSPGGAVPAAARAFRRTVTLPAGHTSASAQALITTDNQYSLYINGRFVGSGTTFQTAQRFSIDNIQGPSVVIAVYGVNGDGPSPNPAGLLASLQITSNDPSSCLNCSSVVDVITDTTWKAFNSVPSGFEQPGFDDTAWPAAVTEGTDGASPWGTVTVPSAVSASGTPLPGAPAGN
ncbi:hypothetical protein K435DRAFT_836954 [Dendrothele bispora CBS 962.96]|uniref:Concanavalin A-like lectin/glucanase n=1 Tax=Dendrothele bispora (strain CBS 962.96) TaxID=1314807 RepID=A0A4S8MF93_DENBC|nr:hypothetical protein K435DRAFT_836954 [Dendrothele bispora CBS 962.96]